MGARRILLPWSEQPTEYSEIASEWASVVAFATLTGQPSRIDAKTRAPAVVSGTINVTNSLHGAASLPTSASSTRLSWTGIKPVNAMGDGYAMMVYAAPSSTATIQRAIGIGDVAAAAYNNVALLFNSTRRSEASAGRVAVIEYSSGDQGTSETATTEVDGRWHTFIVNRGAGTSEPSIYVDGRFASTEGSQNAGVPLTSGVHVHGQPTTTTDGYNGPMSLAVVFNRELTTIELARVAKNPWIIFKHHRRAYVIPSAGGGGATLTADSGTYTLTGTAATLKADRKLAADSGSYAITGTDVSLKLGRKLTAESGTYTVNGTDVSLTAGRKLTADSGTYALTGTDVTLTYQPAGGYTLALDSGSYTLTGTAATLKASRKLTADSGTYALTGTDVTLTRGFKITADSGTYTLTGSNVAFARTYRLPADSGSYALSGSPVSLSWSGEVVPVAPTHGGPSIYGKAVFREAEFKREYEREVSRIENERIRAIQMREDEEIVIIMAALAA